ncbi:MAG TPA: hypothetical protein VFA70_13465 [Dehalococcoidia bacterium]|nr:hypothetical protein [Dehalococcoidia bacterium]
MLPSSRLLGRFGSMLVNVCPSGIASAPPEAVWQVLTATERYGDWIDSDVVGLHPPGPASSGPGGGAAWLSCCSDVNSATGRRMRCAA